MTRSRTLPTIPTIAAFVLAAVALSVAVGLALAPRALHGVTHIGVARFGKRVLIIVPHPDDEVLISGGSIHQLLAEGAQVRVVIVTAGDGYFRAALRVAHGPVGPAAYRKLGAVRHAESEAAARQLGLPARDVISLGFPDGGTSALWDHDWSPATLDHARNGETHVPYAWAYRPGTAYCGRFLANELVEIIRAFNPSTIISTDVHETHPDHSAVAAFSLFAMDEAGFTGTRLTGVVHFKRFPALLAYLPDASLQPPSRLLDDGSRWLAVALDDASEAAKGRALDDYRSQTSIADLGIYMRAFIRRNELFDERQPAKVTTQTTDARPADGTTGTVLVTPKPVVLSRYIQSPRTGSVRLIRGPRTLWIGLVSDVAIAPAVDYRFSLRLIGGPTASTRLDVIVHEGRAQIEHVANDSIDVPDVRAEIDERTLWLSVPVSILDLRTHLLLGSAAGAPRRSPFRTAWRDVAL